MGSPNFANTTGSKFTLSTVFGFVPDYPSDDDVAYARESGDYDEYWTDEDIKNSLFEIEQEQATSLYKAMCEVAQQINDEVACMYEWDYEASFPYTVEVEVGYHDGFSVAIVDRLGVREYLDTTRYWDDVWDYHAEWDTEIQESELYFHNYKKHVEKLGRFMQWAVENAAKAYWLHTITGRGWTQGSRVAEADDFTDFGVEGWKWGKLYPELKFTF